MVGKKLGEFSVSKVLGSDIALSKSRKLKAKKLLKKKK
jgi:ribosomal protein S19